jgi:gamma-glutamyltranspeptidase/glutathione hydrolase
MLRFLIPAILLMSLFASLHDTDAAERHPFQPGKVGRSVVMGPNGMVATSHPLAAEIGLDVLKKGGNAIDAALATNAAIGLMEPMSCGIGGDLFAIVYEAKTGKLYGLNANGKAPLKMTREFFKAKGLSEIPDSGPLSWSIPGCVDGWEELRKKFGTWSFEKILDPVIHYAENGFPVTEVIGGYWKGGEARLKRHPESAEVYLVPGRGEDQRVAPKVGTLFKNPALGKTYREIAQNGRDAFYRGKIAKSLVEFSERNGGLFTLEDLEKQNSVWVEPVKTSYRGHDVWELPPPGQGIAALQMLNLLEGYDLKKWGPTSPDYWHTLIEAKKLVYADRAKFYTDPEFSKVPVAELISKPYGDLRRKLIDPKKANTTIEAGDPKLGKSDTIYLCVVDKDRNCVSLIQSNYNGFGSGLAPKELGFAIQNRGTLFALDENHANRLEPGKRPFHTIIPAMVTKEGKPYLVFGVMGGDMQPQGHVQVLINYLDFGMNIQAAGEAPRIEHVGSATPTGKRGDPEGGTVRAEMTIPDEVLKELQTRGHKVERVRTNGGGYQAIQVDHANGLLLGASEARKDGAAVGY